MKVSMFDLIMFLADKKFWPGDTYHDDSIMTWEGKDLADIDDWNVVPPEAIVNVKGGVVFIDGADGSFGKDGNIVPFERYIKRWLKERETTTVVLSFPNGDLEKVKGVVEKNGWKVISKEVSW